MFSISFKSVSPRVQSLRLQINIHTLFFSLQFYLSLVDSLYSQFIHWHIATVFLINCVSGGEDHTHGYHEADGDGK